eukprot:GILI01026099.1.p1 GENE.GILI01026099.1~~GILI01026099.1.p1  ORF type:complete len:267 (+),score=55.30 GILI01026099.1:165-965(+)
MAEAQQVADPAAVFAAAAALLQAASPETRRRLLEERFGVVFPAAAPAPAPAPAVAPPVPPQAPVEVDRRSEAGRSDASLEGRDLMRRDDISVKVKTQAWLHKLLVYLKNVLRGVPEQSRLDFIGQYFEGDAHNWWRRYDDEDGHTQFEDLADFEAHFRDRFLPESERRALREKIRFVFQTNSVAAYTDKFLWGITEISLRQELNLRCPKTLHAAIKIARDWENSLVALKHELQQPRPRDSKRRSSHQQQPWQAGRRRKEEGVLGVL